jgi:hypothetical protein
VTAPQDLPPVGPLERWPSVSMPQAAGMLKQGLSGLALGRVDRNVREWLTTGLDASRGAVVAGWLRRSFEAGLAAGRTEAVDEALVVQQARAEARSLARRLTTARAARAQVYGWWRDATTERDEARDDVEQLVAELAAAAVEAALVVDDDTADPRVGLRTLLARIEQTVGPRTEGGRR